jgi:hypothetical protein
MARYEITDTPIELGTESALSKRPPDDQPLQHSVPVEQVTGIWIWDLVALATLETDRPAH